MPAQPPDGLPAHTIRRSVRARQARLTVTREGEVVVVLPQRAPTRAATLLVTAHVDWIEAQLRRLAAQRAAMAARPGLADGRVLPIYGVPHRVRVEPDARGDRGAGRVARSLASDAEGLTGELLVRPGAAAPSALAEAWLRAEARRVIVGRVATLAPILGVQPGRVTIRAQRTRWGSASRDGSLSFNWRLLLAPPFVLDAVVVHELAHLVVRGHGPRFWALARRHAPRTDEARAWLRAHHAELLAALD